MPLLHFLVAMVMHHDLFWRIQITLMANVQIFETHLPCRFSNEYRLSCRNVDAAELVLGMPIGIVKTACQTACVASPLKVHDCITLLRRFR